MLPENYEVAFPINTQKRYPDAGWLETDIP